MPTYQYACTECDHRFDAIQSFSDPSLTECPVCGGKLRKVFSSVGIVFKGSGFYRTDSRSGGSGADGKEVKDGKDKVTADSSASSGSSDSKGSSESKGASDSSGKKSDAKPASSSTSSTPAAASA